MEALTGFALWLRRHVGGERLLRSELLEDAEQAFSDIPHQVLCSLTFSGASFDLVLCNELVEHVQELELAFGFPGGADASHRQLEARGAGLGSARFEGWAGLQTLQMS